MKALRTRADAWMPISDHQLPAPTRQLVLACDTMRKWANAFGGDPQSLPCPKIPDIHREQLAMLADKLKHLDEAQRLAVFATVDRILWSCMDLTTDEIFEVSTV